jgi:nitrogen fixation protein NifZ
MFDSQWDFGDAVRVTRNVRNDGTYPGEETGALLIRRGAVGHVVDIGTFLQDQVIYSVHFLDDGRIVGCREEELIGADEPWIPSLFEFRQRVRAARTLASQGEVLVSSGDRGEVLRVLRDAPGEVAYHVHFETLLGRPLVVPESALAAYV